ncbi:MAG: hypothetical protein ACXIUW_06135 [Roseinatronobacter sp.]
MSGLQLHDARGCVTVGIPDALMAQVDLNRRLGAACQEIAAGNGIVADATYFASLRDRALRRTS